MILDHPLNEEQRLKAQRNFSRFNLLNGASYMCLGETVVVLLAIKLDSPDRVLVFISAMMYLGYLLLPFGVMRTGRVGAARSQADFWVLRNVSALIVASSSIVYLVRPPLSWLMLLFGCFLFYGCRAAGLVMAQPLIGDFTTDDDRARFLGTTNSYFYAASVFSLVTVSLVLRRFDSMWALTGIIVAGSCLGVFASSFVRQIDESNEIRDSARKPMLHQLKTILGDSVLRRQIYAGVVFNLANIFTYSMTVSAVKRAYGFSDTRALVMSAVQFAAAVVGSKLTSRVADRYGAKNLMIVGYLLVFPLCLFWLLVPTGLSGSGLTSLVFLFPFINLGLFGAFLNNAPVVYFLKSVPKERQVAGILLINFVTGCGASLLGMLLAAGLVSFAEHMYGSGMPMYRAYFAGSSVILLGGLVFFKRLKRV